MTFVRYVVIQLLAYGIDFGLFLVVLKTGLSGPIMANILAKLTAGTFAFIFHRKFTFRVADSSHMRRQSVRYFVLLTLNIPAASAILALLLLWIAAPVVAKFIADVVCVALTYWLSKQFIFTGQQKCPAREICTGADV